MPEARPLLRVTGVSKTFRPGGLFSRLRVDAVRDVSLEMRGEPSILAVVGESGSGKTTLAKLVLRLEVPENGTIELAGDAIHQPGHRGMPHKQLRRRIQSISQNPFDAFSNYLTVDFYLRRTAINLKGCKDKASIDKAVEVVLHDVGLSLERVSGKYIHQFSGGELQRIAVARALISDPELIVADEPVSMVDASVRMNIINLFNDLKTTRGVSFLYITHDLSTAYYLADDLVIMQKGVLVEHGVPRDVFANPSHPYTRLLIDSIPRVGQRWAELQPPGGEPSLSKAYG